MLNNDSISIHCFPFAPRILCYEFPSNRQTIQTSQNISFRYAMRIGIFHYSRTQMTILNKVEFWNTERRNSISSAENAMRYAPHEIVNSRSFLRRKTQVPYELCTNDVVRFMESFKKFKGISSRHMLTLEACRRKKIANV